MGPGPPIACGNGRLSIENLDFSNTLANTLKATANVVLIIIVLYIWFNCLTTKFRFLITPSNAVGEGHVF